MKNDELKHIEGVAALENNHYNTTNEIKQQFDSLWNWAMRFNKWKLLLLVLLLLSIAGNFRLNYVIERNILSTTSTEDGLRIKLGYRNETEAIHRGIISDDPNYLEIAKTSNGKREGIFEFIHWNNPDRYIKDMLRCDSISCISWVMQQPRWYSCLNESVYFSVLEYVDARAMLTKQTK